MEYVPESTQKHIDDLVKTINKLNQERNKLTSENKALKQQLRIGGVSKSLNADELIKSLGTPDVENEYIVKPDTDGTWWIEHKHVGSGEPLEQWLTGKP